MFRVDIFRTNFINIENYVESESVLNNACWFTNYCVIIKELSNTCWESESGND